MRSPSLARGRDLERRRGRFHAGDRHAMGGVIMFQQMGFGVAVALLIDATIVRGVLVPADVHVEGNRRA
jgi:uncharacterized membrane protein YdfJ with MMPL/SSD domain